MGKKGKKDKKEKKEKDKKDKKGKKGKKDSNATAEAIEPKAAKAPPAPEVKPKPKIDPCQVECPLYCILDVSRCLRDEKYEKFTGTQDDYLYFKKLEDVQNLFDEIKLIRRVKQEEYDTVIDFITCEFADCIEVN